MDQQRKIVRAAPGLGVKTESGSAGGGVEPTNFGSNAAMAAQLTSRGNPDPPDNSVLNESSLFHPEKYEIKHASCNVTGAHRNFYESPWEGDGGATLITSSKVGGGTKDAFSGSRQFLASRSTREDEGEAWQHAVTTDLNQGGGYGEVGDTHAPVTGKKLAVLVGNSEYTSERMSRLPSVPADVAAMGAYYGGQGFLTSTQSNLGAPGMASAFTAPLSLAEPGDHVVLFYAGHGSDHGLQGVNSDHIGRKDILSYAAATGAARAAVKGGFQLTMVLDNCNSDGAQDHMKETVEKNGKAAHMNPLFMNVQDEAQNWTQLQKVSELLGGFSNMTTQQYQWLMEMEHGLRWKESGNPRTSRVDSEFVR